ncbi:uncharacterized protein LOC133199587 [Saccostrea echinata]|uniref:uncharacterized protein LOC133199587 n=1 Tax=Saccostrea echinata TaxID=191078 RepID=UPI002A7F6F0D|nr:uncharacterized protein LOC133199587 [Saccostrea echinata]
MTSLQSGDFHVNKVENLVFGGGGAKGVAYIGVIEVLEQVNILPNVKRFAGTSAGSIVASLLALKCPVPDIQKYMRINFDYLLKDCCCGLCSCNQACCCACPCCCSCWLGCLDRISSCFLTTCGICNLLCRVCSCRSVSFGMYTGDKFKTWLGNRFKELGFSSKVTFKELYEKNGNELCIVVTNISTQIEEYCHVKTTPDMEIRQAVRMSMSIPVVFEDVRMINVSSGREAVYIDGGLLCNYPIFCFDGWWLSMKPEHSFFRKLTDIESMPEKYDGRFKPEKHEDLFKTLGFVLFGDKESELYRRQFIGKPGINKIQTTITEQPSDVGNPEKDPVDGIFKNIETRLKRKFVALNKADKDTSEKYLMEFLEFVADKEENEKLEKTTFIAELQVFKDSNEVAFAALFGYRTPTQVWKYLTQRKGDKLEFEDISRFITKTTGYSVDQWYSGFSYKPCKTTKEFFSSLTSTLITNSSRIHLRDTDIPRTVGINTKYITALDFDMEEDDKNLLVQCGRSALIEFLGSFGENCAKETGKS